MMSRATDPGLCAWCRAEKVPHAGTLDTGTGAGELSGRRRLLAALSQRCPLAGGLFAALHAWPHLIQPLSSHVAMYLLAPAMHDHTLSHLVSLSFHAPC
jgi:hypothetical protein